jgi:hypothetical protein
MLKKYDFAHNVMHTGLTEPWNPINCHLIRTIDANDVVLKKTQTFKDDFVFVVTNIWAAKYTVFVVFNNRVARIALDGVELECVATVHLLAGSMIY